MPNLPQQRNRFQPAEAFFDALPFPLTDAVALMPRRTFINSTAPWTMVILGDVRRYLHVSALLNVVAGVIPLVATHRDPFVARNLFQHH